MNHFQKIFFFSLLILIFSCTGGVPPKNEVTILELADPEMLNPINATDATSNYICLHIFQKLIDVDFRNPEKFTPVLAEALPLVEKTSDSTMSLTFRIRKEATWDNGSPVTAKDVEFTLKMMKCPLTNDPNARPYFDYIADFKFYDDDPKKFTILSNQLYFGAEPTFTDIPIYPEYMYDPKGLLQKFTIKQIAGEGDKLSSDATMKEFADDFNSEKRMRDPNFIAGSGAYKFTDWKNHERVTLTKKENWWGDALEKENCYFEAYPQKIIFQIIKDNATALVSLKAGNLDVMRSIKSKDFSELPQSEKFTKNFNAYKPMTYAYTYFGINHKSKFFTDKRTRQAMAHLVDVDKIIQTVKYGLAERIIGPVHPSKKKAYNSSLLPYDFNPEKAKELLKEAGWENTNGDETLDKMIDGKRTEFVIDFYCNSETDERKAMVLMFQEEAKKVGIRVNLILRDFVTYLGICRNHEFDMMIGKWISGPSPDDFKATFHTDGATGDGSNYDNFSNREADSLMVAIRKELDEDKRAAMYKRLQEIFHDEVAMIFLYAPAESIAISKRFENADASVVRPGYWAQSFKVKQ